MKAAPAILYLDMVPGEHIQKMKLAGMRRYAAARGWEVVAVPERDSRPGNLPLTDIDPLADGDALFLIC